MEQSGLISSVLVNLDVKFFCDDVQYYLVKRVVCSEVAVSRSWYISTFYIHVAWQVVTSCE